MPSSSFFRVYDPLIFEVDLETLSLLHQLFAAS